LSKPLEKYGKLEIFKMHNSRDAIFEPDMKSKEFRFFKIVFKIFPKLKKKFG
jgi:hypothetical protein